MSQLSDAINRLADVLETQGRTNEALYQENADVNRRAFETHQKDQDARELTRMGALIDSAPHFQVAHFGTHIRDDHGYSTPTPNEQQAVYIHTELHKSKIGHQSRPS